jgi:hypothetical protein
MIDLTPPARQDIPAGHHTARRAHLMSEMTARPRRLSGRRLLIGGLTTAGLASGLAAALVIFPTAGVGGNPPVARAGAAEILNRAATTAANQPDLRPRPDQFVYVESKSRQAPLSAGEGLPTQPGLSTHRRAWLSVSGKRAGLLRNAGKPPIWLCDAGPNATGKEPKMLPKVDLTDPPIDCHGVPAVRNLPTDAGAMRSWLYRNSQGGNPPDVQAFVTVGDTLRESYVSPAAKAAMFKATATIPGVTVTGNTVDLAGRKGVAVGQTWHGIRHELIFEAGTYRLLGERQIVDHDDSFQPSGGKAAGLKSSGTAPDPIESMKQGTVLYTMATLKLTIADKVAQVPVK